MSVNPLNTIVYTIWFLFSVLLFLLANSIGTLMIAVLTVLLPILFLIGARITSKKTDISFRIKGKCQKGEPVQGKVVVRNFSILPASSVCFTLRAHNLLNGTEETFTFHTDVPSAGVRELDFTLSAAYAGETQITAEKAYLTDLLSLVRFSLVPSRLSRCAVTVMPKIFPCQVDMRENSELMPDSDTYSMKKAGTDIGEIYQIREYVPGDEIRYIHWKLSQKVDKLMVKELGFPIQNNILLLFDNSFAASETPDPKQIDGMVDSLWSLAEGITYAEQPFTFAFADTHMGQTEFAEVIDSSGIASALSKVLGTPFRSINEGESLFYGSDLEIRRFQHIMIFSLNESSDYSLFFNSNHINCFMMNEAQTENTVIDGVTVHYITPDTFKKSLSIVEI